MRENPSHLQAASKLISSLILDTLLKPVNTTNNPLNSLSIHGFSRIIPLIHILWLHKFRQVKRFSKKDGLGKKIQIVHDIDSYRRRINRKKVVTLRNHGFLHSVAFNGSRVPVT